jgi:hypothetical protein
LLSCSGTTELESCLYRFDACPEGTSCDVMTQRCVSDKLVPAEPCLASIDCPDGTRPICSATRTCTSCTSWKPLDKADAECAALGAMKSQGPMLAACVSDGMRKGQCGECREASAEAPGVACRAAARPVCDGGTCRACRRHGECEDTGICNDGSGLVDVPGVAVGQCLPREKTTFVDAMHCPTGPTGPETAADGSRERPFCELEPAVRAAAGRGGYIVVRSSFSVSDGKRTVIVGTGREAPPLLRAVAVSGAGTRVMLSDVMIGSPTGSAALSCTGGAQLSVVRGFVDGSGSTQLGVDASGCDRIDIAESQLLRSRGPAVRIGPGTRSYRVVNTLITSSASVGPSAVTIANGASGTFAWNTILNNGPPGTDGGAVTCEGPASPLLSDSLIVQNGRSSRTDPRGNPAGTQFMGCRLQRVVTGVDGAIFTGGAGAAIGAIPDLDARLHLVDTPNNGTCCVDKGGPCDDVTQDYYGGTRPQGRACDLGAHELR